MNCWQENSLTFTFIVLLFLPLPQKKCKIYSSWIYNQYTVGSGIVTVGPTRGQIFFSGAIKEVSLSVMKWLKILNETSLILGGLK